MSKDIGKRMQQYRIATGFSLDDLSQHINVPKVDLMRVELGQTAPSNFLIVNLCQLYGIKDFSKPVSPEAPLFDAEEGDNKASGK